jgi:hypothetical protein
MQLAMRIRPIIICGLPGSKLSNKFSEEKVIENEMCVWSLYKTYVWNVYFESLHNLCLKCVFWVSIQLMYEMCILSLYTIYVWNISHSKKNWARYDEKWVLVFRWSTHYPCQILIKVEFCPQIFETYSNIKYYENMSSGSWVVPWGRADERTNMTKLIVAFRNFAKAPKN